MTLADRIQSSSVSIKQFVATADKTIGNTTIETTMFGTGDGSLTISANSLAVGDIIRIKLQGHYSTKTAPVGNLTLKPKFGGVNISANSDAPNAGETDKDFNIEMILVVRTIGETGTIMGTGMAIYQYTQGGDITQFWPVGASTVITVDTTSALVIDMTAQWATANASNSITVFNSTIELLH